VKFTFDTDGYDFIKTCPEFTIEQYNQLMTEWNAILRLRKVALQLPDSTTSGTVHPVISQPVDMEKDVRISTSPVSFEKDEDGAITTHRATFEVKDGAKVVVRCVVAVIEEEGEPVKLYTNIQPLGSELGVELRREEVYSGEFARIYADVIAAARDLLGDSSRSNRSDSSRSVHIDLDI
jgi:hypothetical protein